MLLAHRHGGGKPVAKELPDFGNGGDCAVGAVSCKHAAKLADGKKITMVFPSPIKSAPYAIEGQWIDYNGHFNMAYYNVLFDRDSDVALDLVGLGPAYVEKTGNSYFTLEAHVSYLRELGEKDQVWIATQFLDFDSKRLHYVQMMHHAREDWIACVNEIMIMHVDLGLKKSSPFPANVLEKIRIACEAHKSLPVPLQVGHKIGIPRKA
jgi:acyl-CoA thioester hydrolase